MIDEVLQQFGLAGADPVQSMGNAGGFSGARIWKISNGDRDLCLRRWPRVHPSVERLEWIHRILGFVSRHGSPVAAPILNNRDKTFVRDPDGFLWEMTPWLSGQADFNLDPSLERLQSLFTELARFHQLAARIQLEFGVSKNLAARLSQLETLDHELSQCCNRISSQYPAYIHELAAMLARVKPAVSQLIQQLRSFASIPLPIQPVIRDVWHDHLFFEGDQLVGICDFGAMQIDTVALDLGRVISSLILDSDQCSARGALGFYELNRTLLPVERQLVSCMSQTSILLGALNWLKWLAIDRRSFDDSSAVERRICFLIDGLGKLVTPSC